GGGGVSATGAGGLVWPAGAAGAGGRIELWPRGPGGSPALSLAASASARVWASQAAGRAREPGPPTVATPALPGLLGPAGRGLGPGVVGRHGRPVGAGRVGEAGAGVGVNVELFDLPGGDHVLLGERGFDLLVGLLAVEGARAADGPGRAQQA